MTSTVILSDCQLLVYDYVEDMAQRWLPYHDAHAQRILSEREAGRILIAGRFEPPVGGAIVFTGVDADWIETWVQADPYVKAGLVTGHRVDQWLAR